MQTLRQRRRIVGPLAALALLLAWLLPVLAPASSVAVADAWGSICSAQDGGPDSGAAADDGPAARSEHGHCALCLLSLTALAPAAAPQRVPAAPAASQAWLPATEAGPRKRPAGAAAWPRAPPAA